MAISIQGLDFAFAADKPVFRGLHLELREESPAVILGPSGCGKTTLLRLIAGLLKPSAGEIRIQDDPPQERFPGREAAISMVFQEPRLLPWKTVLENVSLPLAEKLGKREAGERARHFLKLVSLEDRAAALPGELSGGQRQRVNLARAFAWPGRILLMDEPFQSLDIPLRIELMDITRSLLEHSGRLALMVTHDPREAVYMGRRILVLGANAGGIIHDEPLDLDREDRSYGSAAQGRLERKLLAKLGAAKEA
jgi:NitT/TauT family transport system ATP-binding protein